VQELQAIHGKNKLTPVESKSAWAIFVKNLFGGFQCLLWAGAALCLIAWAVQFPTEAPVNDNVSQSFLNIKITSKYVNFNHFSCG